MTIFRFNAAAIMDFLKFQIFNGLNGQGVELRLQANFRQNRLNRGRDITILRFFQDGGRPP